MEQKNVALIKFDRNFFQDYNDGCNISNGKDSNCVKEPETEIYKGLKESRVKARYIVILLCFLCQFIFLYQRITMSVSIVAMVNNSFLVQKDVIPATDSCPVDNDKVKSSSGNITVKVVEGEFFWSPKIQGYLLGSSFVCCIFALPLCARLAEKYGGKKVMFWSLFLTSVVTFVSPFAAYLNVYILMIVQSLRGIAEGSLMPAQSILVANWCPKQERGLSYTLILNGTNIGAVCGSYLTGLLCESTYLGGWKSAFFVSGALGFSVSVMVWFFLYDNPSVHPKISPAELHYIISNQENALTEKRPKTPWRKLISSIPVYALTYAYFGEMWAVSHFLTVNPTFLKTILHYSVEQSGLFAALPSLLAILFTYLSGFLSTLMTSRNLMSIEKARKFWSFMSSLGYSCCVLGIYFAKCNKPVIVTLSVFAYAITGFSSAGCWIVSNDMSPTFTASINAIACTIGYLAHILLPLTVGYLTNNSQTLEQWHNVFLINISVVLSSGVVFVIFGSAKIQPWNDVSEEKSEKKNFEMKSNSQSQSQTFENCNVEKTRFEQ